MKNLALPFVLAAVLGASASVATAQDKPLPPRIIVSGEGEATVAPDLALLSLSVMREAVTAREALDGNNKAMTEVIAALKEMGIADRDLQTAGIQVNPRYDYVERPDRTQEAKLAGYQVTNTVSVRIRDLAKSGEIIDRAVSLGVNQGGGLTFSNENPKSVLSEARKLAVQDAVDKAKVLAEAAGVTLGRVTEISDTIVQAVPMPITAKAFDRQELQSVPVQAGENAYRVQVNMTFELN